MSRRSGVGIWVRIWVHLFVLSIIFWHAGVGMVWAACAGEAAVPPEGFTWPVKGAVSQAWSLDCRTDKGHRGIDISVAPGEAISAAAGGTVSFSGYTPAEGGGITVTVDHAGGLRTTYLHLQSALVSKSQTVTQGQQIGISNGAALHFGVKDAVGDIYYDPAGLLPPLPPESTGEDAAQPPATDESPAPADPVPGTVEDPVAAVPAPVVEAPAAEESTPVVDPLPAPVTEPVSPAVPVAVTEPVAAPVTEPMPAPVSEPLPAPVAVTEPSATPAGWGTGGSRTGNAAGTDAGCGGSGSRPGTCCAFGRGHFAGSGRSPFRPESRPGDSGSRECARSGDLLRRNRPGGTGVCRDCCSAALAARSSRTGVVGGLVVGGTAGR